MLAQSISYFSLFCWTFFLHICFKTGDFGYLKILSVWLMWMIVCLEWKDLLLGNVVVGLNLAIWSWIDLSWWNTLRLVLCWKRGSTMLDDGPSSSMCFCTVPSCPVYICLHIPYTSINSLYLPPVLILIFYLKKYLFQSFPKTWRKMRHLTLPLLKQSCFFLLCFRHRY